MKDYRTHLEVQSTATTFNGSMTVEFIAPPVHAGGFSSLGFVVSHFRFARLQSSSRSRHTASLSGFFDFSQVLDGPLR
jgi:hypothetical protein